MLQIGDQIIHILQPDGKPNQSVGDAELLALLQRHRRVRHHRRQLGQAFVPAEAFREREHVQRLQEVARLLQPAADVERHDAAVPVRLPLGQLMLRVAWQARVQHPLHLWMRFEEPGNRQRVALVAFHAQGERFQAPVDQIAVERGWHNTGG